MAANNVLPLLAMMLLLFTTAASAQQVSVLSVDRLAAAAAVNDMAPAALAEVLATDASATLTDSNRLFYTCEFGHVHAAPNNTADDVSVGVANAATSAGAPDPPVSDVWKLHSRPAAKAKIFLQFNGCVTTGTFYNEQYKVSVITTPAWPQATDNDLQKIIAIWRGVAELYAMFDVDVTTQDVTTLVGTYGTKVCMGGSPTDCEFYSFLCVSFFLVLFVLCVLSVYCV